MIDVLRELTGIVRDNQKNIDQMLDLYDKHTDGLIVLGDYILLLAGRVEKLERVLTEVQNDNMD